MTSNKIIWFTAFSQEYYNNVFSKVSNSWDLLPGDIEFLIDDPSIKITSQHNLDIIDLGDRLTGHFNNAEIKFWKKSRSIVHALEKYKEMYDFCIWLDADVQVLESPNMDLLLPSQNEILSANRKIPKDGTALDTGFVAFNLKHQKIDQLLNLYKNFWYADKINRLPFRYDACVLEHLLLTTPIKWKNLWSGDITKGKAYCGFEDSCLDNFFFHHWGKKAKSKI
jgi:hypothetical protein